MRPFAALAVAVVAAFAVALPAHGGQYRGPIVPTPAVPPPGAGGPSPAAPRPAAPPTTGGPRAPNPGVPGNPAKAGAAMTGTPTLSSDSTNWETWWEFNKDPFLRVAVLGQQAPVTGSDDFYLGPRRPEAPIDLLEPTAADRTDRIVPALAKLLASDRNSDIASACLVALGKVGCDAAGVELEKVLASHIARDDQEVREAAVLALGIAGRPQAMPVLVALLSDDATGRKLVDRAEVGERTRAFAAYGLGLLARRHDDVSLKAAARDALWAPLQERGLQNRDLRVAAVSALGILACGRGAQKRLQWQVVEDLLAFVRADLGRSEEVVQAHAPIAIARLLGRGTSDLHQKAKGQFAAMLGGRERRGNPLQQSAAVALGGLLLPAEQHADDGPATAALQQYYERGHDRQARFFALIALGRTGGEANRTWLLEAYERSNKATERPWVALALGLLAADRAAAGDSDATIALRLLDDLHEIQNQDVQGALAIALGLTAHQPVAPAVLRLLRDNEGQERIAGHLCVSLALLGDQAAVPTLSAVLERSSRRPFLLLQAATALGRLGDRDATPRLLRAMQENDSVAVLSSMALALEQIGDRRSIEPLVALTADAGLTKLARAFVAAALGGVGDADPLRWNLPLVVDCNYAAAVDTLTNGATGVLDIL